MDLRTLLKREESYALHALINVAENPGTNSVTIAEQLAMPPAFMAKVLRKLTVAGFVESRSGRNGGVNVKVDLEQVTILDVIEGISGTVVLDTCQTQSSCAIQRRKGHCNLRTAAIATTLAIRESLSAINLADLYDPPED